MAAVDLVALQAAEYRSSGDHLSIRLLDSGCLLSIVDVPHDVLMIRIDHLIGSLDHPIIPVLFVIVVVVDHLAPRQLIM